MRATAAGAGGASLVTADGGVDCMHSPADQETMSAQLHLCELIGALGVLRIDGCFVLKMFTLFEHSSLGILYVLGAFFKSVIVCKPTMSAPGNSEVYVVARGFRGVAREWLEHVLRYVGRDWPTSADGLARALVSNHVIRRDPEWEAAVVECACYFAHAQVAAIRRNIALFERMDRKTVQVRLMLLIINVCVCACMCSALIR